MTGLEEKLTIENAMSKFRSEKHESAKTRLEAAFTGAEIEVVDQPQFAAADTDENMSSGLKEVIGNASELLAQADRLMTDANDTDAEEMRELIDQLREAIQAKEPNDIKETCVKLDDLVFYLQDAS